MRSLYAAVVLLAPWVTGALVILAKWRDLEHGRWCIALGYGYFLGTAAAAALLWLQGRLGLALNPFPITVFFIGLCFFLIRRVPATVFRIRSFQVSRESTFTNVLAATLLIVLFIRVGSLAIAMGQNGLDQGWDAATTWMYRARVWVETERLVGFVSSAEWLTAPKAPVYALAAWQYPPLVSLIAALPSLAYGDWHEWWSSIPWLCAYVALGFALYGQCREWRTPKLIALITVWLVLSLPLLGSQVAVSGYADLWMSASLSLAFVSFMGWVRDRKSAHGYMSVLMIAITIFLKIEGIIWSLLFVPALIVARWSVRGLLGLTSVLAVLLMAIALWGPFENQVPFLGRLAVSTTSFATDLTGTFELVRQEGVGRPLLVHLFVFGSMHLLALVVLISLVSQALPALLGEVRAASAEWQRAGVTWVLTMCLALYVLFFWTPAGEWVRQGTSVNRLILQMAPALVFWCHLILMDGLSRSRSKSSIGEP